MRERTLGFYIGSFACVLIVAGCGNSQSPADVQSCIQKLHYSVATPTLDTNAKNLGEVKQLKVTTDTGDLFFVDIWKDTKAADFYVKGDKTYRAFGKITIDDPNSAAAKKMEGCF